jgi:hypothetical protein
MSEVIHFVHVCIFKSFGVILVHLEVHGLVDKMIQGS